MTAAEISAKSSTQTIGNYLPVMVEDGAIRLVGRRPRRKGDRGVQPYLYGLPEWSSDKGRV